MEPFYSVIIPMYNSEMYIGACLESVLAQKDTSLEIIVVDDGSSDSSASIVRTYMEYEPEIKLISKENGGVASARNVGLMHSTGRYIFFLDSDDVMLPQALKDISRHIKKPEKDIYVCGSYYELANGELHVNRMFNDEAFDKKLDYRTIKCLCQNLSSMCIALYKREFLLANQLKVVEGITMAEDTDFYFRCLLACKSIALIDQAAFAYRYNPSSVSNSLTSRNILDVMCVCGERMHDLLEKTECDIDKVKALNFFATKYIHFSIKAYQLKENERKECIEVINKDLELPSHARNRIDHAFYILAKLIGVKFTVIIYNYGVQLRNKLKK